MIFPVSHPRPLSGNEANVKDDVFWMQRALALAKTASQSDEVPVGAVLVLNEEIIGEGHNQPIQAKDPTAHAEMVALRAGATTLNNYRLVGGTLYVTLEPCLMCVGAMVHARIKRLVYGARDAKTGAIVSRMQALDLPFLNHRIDYQGDLLAPQCGALLSHFFQEKRLGKKELI
jgi:tRNA(adenine34) deaminase